MAITKAQQKATAKYIKNNYDEIKTRVPKGRKAEIQAHAEKQGKSLNAFVNEAIDEKIERDNAEDNQWTISNIPLLRSEMAPDTLWKEYLRCKSAALPIVCIGAYCAFEPLGP